MPSFAQWLKASWAAFARRWGVLLGVAGTAGAATLLAGALPLVPAAIAAALGVGPAWAVWGFAGSVSVLGVLWLSTWGQAALARAALSDEELGACLKGAWRQTPAFAWVLTLVLLAVAGGWFLLVLPGVLLSFMLFASPFYLLSGEADGIRALELSWARVRPRFWTAAGRFLAAAAIAALPGRIPYVGWIIAMFWTPIGVVLLARLASDLRAAEPAAEPPRWMAPAVAGLGLVFALGAGAASWSALTFYRRVAADPAGLMGFFERGLDAETGQAVVAVLSGSATPEQQKKALDFALSSSSSLQSVAVSTAALGSPAP